MPTTSTGRRSGRLVAALLSGLLLAVAPSVVLPALAPDLMPPAGAATCTSSGGVSVVVDHRELGGGIATGCAASSGGHSAAAASGAAGVTLTYATRQPGFVCRVNGVPASEPCVNAAPADAYWGLWWSDGTSGWRYATSGAGALTVPAGGSVAWVWQQDRGASSPAAPGIAVPKAPKASPSPSQSPTRSPSTSPSKTPSPSATSSSKPSPSTSTTPTGTPSASPTATPSESASVASSRDGGKETKKAKRQRRPLASGKDRRSAGATSTPSAPATADIEPISGKAAASAEQPGRIPGWLTWSVFAVLLLVLVAGAVVSRRRAHH
jgi:hypothetical protein